MPVRPTRAEIDLDAIAHNVRLIRKRIAPAEVIAVVKSDAYGHGAVPVSEAALHAGAAMLGVALVEEGEALRVAGITAPILLLSEPPTDAAPRVVASDITPTVYTLDFGEALRLEAGRRNRPLQIHVKADTGMGRVGIPRDDWDRLLRAIRAWPELEVRSFWTHLACADVPGHPSVDEQLERFELFLGLARTRGFDTASVHVANSAGALTLDEHHDGVRLGIAMYGCPPSPELEDAADLHPVMRFVTEVAFAKRVPAGTRVSYGHTWQAPTDGWLATLPVGYADGVPRLLSNRAEVIIGGRRRPIAGNVCMDMIIVWCGDDEVVAGEEAVLIGAQGDARVTAQEWATMVGTISYEICTGVSSRVPRTYRGGPSDRDERDDR